MLMSYKIPVFWNPYCTLISLKVWKELVKSFSSESLWMFLDYNQFWSNLTYGYQILNDAPIKPTVYIDLQFGKFPLQLKLP